jgi:hypothetical protein
MSHSVSKKENTADSGVEDFELDHDSLEEVGDGEHKSTPGGADFIHAGQRPATGRH